MQKRRRLAGPENLNIESTTAPHGAIESEASGLPDTNPVRDPNMTAPIEPEFNPIAMAPNMDHFDDPPSISEPRSIDPEIQRNINEL